MKTIYIGADHAGFNLKEQIKKYLAEKKLPYHDLGNLNFNKNDDYPDFAEKVAEAVVRNKTLGILVCGSSHGVAIVANKIKGVRATSVRNTTEAKLVKEHNFSNILCLSGGGIQQKTKSWVMDFNQVKKIINIWLKTPFGRAKRHQRRVNKIKKIEKKNFK